MNDPQFAAFRKGMDAEPENWQLKLVFADWLEERGSPLAAGYKYMGERKKRPLGKYNQDAARYVYSWFSNNAQDVKENHCKIDTRLRIKLKPIRARKPAWDTGLGYWARQSAEEALCKALNELTAELEAKAATAAS